jgi:formylglycine-generating enzyme required for sulfatase activity
VRALAELGERFIQPITGMLDDDYPQVRVAAIHALERLDPDGTWREHLRYECYVPAGEFVMGDDDSDRDDEKPAHKVYLDAFYIGKYPVTNAQYKCYMDDIGRAFEVPQGKADHPVVHVTWYDARDYAAWAGMRLLTEAEWEKAASWDERAQGGEGRKRRYPWGDKFDKHKCNIRESGIGDTTPVGKYSPEGDSPYGVADMAGNVWEWTSSLHELYPYQADDGREDPGAGERRVLRGSSFASNVAGIARCARRYYLNTDYRDWDLGIRCAAAPFSQPLRNMARSVRSKSRINVRDER